MDDGDRLKLNLENRCGEVRNRCTCPGYKPPGLETKKVTGDHNAVGFIAYTHSNKEGFTLSNNLGDGEKLEDEEVKKVTSVSVYYWDGDKNYDKPLLLEVKKKDDPKSFYYLRYDETETGDQPAVWKQYNGVGTSLQALLDDRNLGRNNVFPLDLNQPEKNLEPISNIAKTVNIQHVPGLQTLSGSEYTITEYKLNGDGNTRFSRVMHGKDRVNGITIPNDIISNIRLYSSPINNSKVPIMFEFVGKDGGNSKWFHNQNKGTGTTQWGEIGNPEGFHSDKNNSISTLTEKFTRKLDGLVCENYNGVTIDLSRNRSEGRSYCCEHHTGEKGTGKVSVKTEELALNGGVNKLPYYKHHIEAGQKVADIKFYQDDNEKRRRRIRSSKFDFPMEGPVDIYTFYSGNNPALIYVNAEQSKPPVKGWFRRDSSGYGATWKKTSHSLRSIKHKDIYEKRLNCTQWTALREILNKRDGNLEECQEPPRPQGSVARNDSDGVPEIGSEEDDEESADDSEHSKSTLSSPRLSPTGAPGRGGPGPPGEKGGKGETGDNGNNGEVGGKRTESGARGSYSADSNLEAKKESDPKPADGKVPGTPDVAKSAIKAKVSKGAGVGDSGGGAHISSSISEDYSRSFGPVTSLLGDFTERAVNYLTELKSTFDSLPSHFSTEVIKTAPRLANVLARAAHAIAEVQKAYGDQPSEDPETTLKNNANQSVQNTQPGASGAGGDGAPPGAPSTGKASRGDTPSAGKDAQSGAEALTAPDSPQALGVATAGAMSLGTIFGGSASATVVSGGLTGLGSLDLSFIRAVVEIL